MDAGLGCCWRSARRRQVRRPSFAQAPAGAARAGRAPGTSAPAAEKADPARLFPPDAVSRHVLAEGDKRLAYTATAGTLPLLGPKGEVSARIFSVAYTLDEKAADRPVTFVFNGGPGAASAFLHLGAMGPRAVNFSRQRRRGGAAGRARRQPRRLARLHRSGVRRSRGDRLQPQRRRHRGGRQGLLRRREGRRRDGRFRAPLSHAHGAHAGAGVPGGRELRRVPGGAAGRPADRQRHGRERRRDDLAGARILHAARQPLCAAPHGAGAALDCRHASGAPRRCGGFPRYPAGSRAVRALGLSRAPGGGPQERRGDRPHARALHRAGAGRDPQPPEPGVDAHLHARIREGRRPRAQPLRRHRQRPGAAPQRHPLRPDPGRRP